MQCRNVTVTFLSFPPQCLFCFTFSDESKWSSMYTAIVKYIWSAVDFLCTLGSKFSGFELRSLNDFSVFISFIYSSISIIFPHASREHSHVKYCKCYNNLPIFTSCTRPLAGYSRVDGKQSMPSVCHCRSSSSCLYRYFANASLSSVFKMPLHSTRVYFSQQWVPSLPSVMHCSPKSVMKTRADNQHHAKHLRFLSSSLLFVLLVFTSCESGGHACWRGGPSRHWGRRRDWQRVAAAVAESMPCYSFS